MGPVIEEGNINETGDSSKFYRPNISIIAIVNVMMATVPSIFYLPKFNFVNIFPCQKFVPYSM